MVAAAASLQGGQERSASSQAGGAIYRHLSAQRGLEVTPARCSLPARCAAGCATHRAAAALLWLHTCLQKHQA